MTTIGFIGAGKMAEALIRAIINSKVTKQVIASDVNAERLGYLKKELGIKTSSDNCSVVKNSDVVFLAVKPQNMDFVLSEIADCASGKLVISIAAGIKIKKIESGLSGARVVRVMPNTPCLVGEMAAGVSGGGGVTDKDLQLVSKILNSAGKAFIVCEEMIDAVTGLSGSGPAFMAYLLEGFIEGGIKQGLSKDVATELAMQTMIGTGKLLQQTGLTPKELIDMVSSPNGTTVAGMAVLEKSDVKKVISDTVKKATERSKELGK